MKKKLFSILIVTLMLLSATSCSFVKIDVENGGEKEGVIDIQKENEKNDITEKLPDEPLKEDEEKIQEDTDEKGEYLHTIPGEGTRIVSAVDDSDYFVFARSFAGTGFEREYYGIVDIDGNEIIAPTYTTLGWCDWHEVIYAEPFPEGTPDVIIDENYKISLHYGHGAEGGGMYLYEKRTGKYFEVFGFGGLEFVQVQDIPEMTPYYVYDDETPLNEGYYESMLGENPAYEKIQDALYNFGEGEFEFISDKGDTVSLGVLNYVYPNFVNGYYIVRRGDKWGYIDGLGNEASEFIYDGAIQATSDGRAWVEHEGCWKVLKLK